LENILDHGCHAGLGGIVGAEDDAIGSEDARDERDCLRPAAAIGSRIEVDLAKLRSGRLLCPGSGGACQRLDQGDATRAAELGNLNRDFGIVFGKTDVGLGGGEAAKFQMLSRLPPSAEVRRNLRREDMVVEVCSL